MPLDATLRIIDKRGYMRNWDYRPARFESSSTRRNDNGGKGVSDNIFYLCHGTDLILFTDTLQRVLLLIRRIWFKLSTAFTLLLGRSEDILTSRLLSWLLNLLSSIEWSRTFFKASSNLLLHRWTVWDGVNGKVSEKWKNSVEMVGKPNLNSFVRYLLSWGRWCTSTRSRNRQQSRCGICWY